MPKLVDCNPESAPGDWYIDTHCIDCAASREVAPGLVIHRRGKSVFGRQPANEEEELAAWRAVLLCPTASVGTKSHRAPPSGLFPQELAPRLYRCGYNARSSFGAHSYFATRDEGNLLVAQSAKALFCLQRSMLERRLCYGRNRPRCLYLGVVLRTPRV